VGIFNWIVKPVEVIKQAKEETGAGVPLFILFIASLEAGIGAVLMSLTNFFIRGSWYQLGLGAFIFAFLFVLWSAFLLWIFLKIISGKGGWSQALNCLSRSFMVLATGWLLVSILALIPKAGWFLAVLVFIPTAVYFIAFLVRAVMEFYEVSFITAFFVVYIVVSFAFLTAYLLLLKWLFSFALMKLMPRGATRMPGMFQMPNMVPNMPNMPNIRP